MIVGSVTDAYNPQEEIFRRTRAFLEQMQGSGINLIITTKSDLVLRDLNLIKTFPSPLISWSINTLDENFKNDMDRAVSIERRIAAMKKCHEAGIRTTCFISPIFPEITEVFEIIERIKDFCDYIWLENLNLRSNFKAQIMEYIGDKYTELLPLYQQIYNKNDMTYWQVLDCKMAEYAEANGFLYVIDEEPFLRNPTGKPIIINYFYHSQIKQTAKRSKLHLALRMLLSPFGSLTVFTLLRFSKLKKHVIFAAVEYATVGVVYPAALTRKVKRLAGFIRVQFLVLLHTHLSCDFTVAAFRVGIYAISLA